MWHIEAFDTTTESLAAEHPLPKLDTSAVRRILNIHDEQPVEPFLFDVNQPDIFNALAEFGDDAVALEPERTYYLAFSSVAR